MSIEMTGGEGDFAPGRGLWRHFANLRPQIAAKFVKVAQNRLKTAFNPTMVSQNPTGVVSNPTRVVLNPIQVLHNLTQRSPFRTSILQSRLQVA